MAAKIITLIGKEGNVVFKGKLTSFPLDDRQIIKKSIEMFNDSEPCIIHKTYIMKKIMLEIDDYLNILIEQGKVEISWDDVPEYIKQVLDIRDEISEILIN